MSLKVILPFSLLVFGGSATATAGVYAHTKGSGKGPNREDAGNAKTPHTPDNLNPTNKPETAVPSGEREKQQADRTPTGDEGSSKETPDNGKPNPATESTVEKTPTLEGGETEVRGEDQGQKDGTSVSGQGDSLPKGGIGENQKQSGDPKITEGLEQPSDQGTQDQVVQHTDNSQPKAEPVAGNPSPEEGDNADQQPQTSGGQEKQTGHQDDSNKEKGVDVTGGSVGGTATPSGAGSNSEGTPPSTSSPAS